VALTIPNLDKIMKVDPKLGEALQKIQSYTNLNVTPVPGNKKQAPAFTNPGVPRG
jgi:hypothetical protein